MSFQVGSLIAYIIAMGAGLGLPALSLQFHGQSLWVELSLNTLSFLLLLLSAAIFNLIIAKLFFPDFWWMAQIMNQDIYQFEGVYFIGVRQSRQKSRLHRIVFGVDDKMRRWDLLFGLLLLTMIFPHMLGGYSIHGLYSGMVSDMPRLAETLHGSTLSSLPVMGEIQADWSMDPELAGKVSGVLGEARKSPAESIPQWYRLAQLHLLNSFQLREKPQDTYTYSPGDSIKFDRGQGAEAVGYLKRILAKPEQERAGWSRGALTLIGFFHLSAHDFNQASGFFDKALAAAGDGEDAGIPRYQIVLLAAQAAMLSGEAGRAEVLLESILEDERLPSKAHALATEHIAGALRLGGRPGQAASRLAKALELYEKSEDRAGVARVHLRMAAMAIDNGRFQDAGREISAAASLAHGLNDGFTLNLVEWLTQFYPKPS